MVQSQPGFRRAPCWGAGAAIAASSPCRASSGRPRPPPTRLRAASPGYNVINTPRPGKHFAQFGKSRWGAGAPLFQPVCWKFQSEDGGGAGPRGDPRREGSSTTIRFKAAQRAVKMPTTQRDDRHDVPSAPIERLQDENTPSRNRAGPRRCRRSGSSNPLIPFSRIGTKQVLRARCWPSSTNSGPATGKPDVSPPSGRGHGDECCGRGRRSAPGA